MVRPIMSTLHPGKKKIHTSNQHDLREVKQWEEHSDICMHCQEATGARLAMVRLH